MPRNFLYADVQYFAKKAPSRTISSPPHAKKQDIRYPLKNPHIKPAYTKLSLESKKNIPPPLLTTYTFPQPSTHNQPHPHKSCIFTISWSKYWEFPKTILIGVMKQRSSNWYQWCYYSRDGYSSPAYSGRLPSALKRQTLHACSCHISLLHAEQRLSLRLLELLI